MKAQILKIAGVKNEKEFYKKFPTEEAFMKKHGKQLKKAAGGMPVAGLPGMTFDDASGIGKIIKTDKTNNLLSGIATSLGPIVGAVQDYNQTDKDINNLKAYGEISDVVAKAAATRPERLQRKIDYNAMRSQTVNPLGVGTNYLAAEDGAEIQNTFDPNTIYTDMGYEPLNDSTRVKQFVSGGGLNLDPFSGIAGTLGGNLGSAITKGTGRGGAASSIGSSLGGVAGNFLLPGVGGALGSLAGGVIGGLIDGGQQNELQMAEDKLTSNVNTATLQSGVQSFLSGKSAFAEDGGWVSNDWMPQTITKFGDYSMDQLLAPPKDADMLRSGGHLAQVPYTPPSARAMYTGRMDDGGVMHSTNMMFDTDRYPRAKYGSQMAFGGDVQVGNGYMRPLSNDVQELVGPSHEDGGMPFSNGNNLIEAEGKETVMKTYGEGGPMDDGSVTIFGNRYINQDAADFVGIKPGRKYKIESKELALNQTKFEKKATKNFASANDMEVSDMFSQIEQRTKLLNGEAFTKKAAMAKQQLQDLAIYQNETGDAAEALGLEINAFDKGIAKQVKKSNMAKFGAKLESFAVGGKVGTDKKKPVYDREFENFIGPAIDFEIANSGESPNGYRGGGSNYGTNNPNVTSLEKAKEYYYKNYWSKVKDLPEGLRTRALQLAINTGDPYGELMVAAGKMSVDKRRSTKDQRKDKDITGNKDWEKSKADILKAYKEDPQGFLFNLDKEQNRYYDSLVEANTDKETGKAFKTVDPKDLRKFYSEYMNLTKNAYQSYTTNPLAGVVTEQSAPISSGLPASSASSQYTAIPGAAPAKTPISPSSIGDLSKDERKAMAIANGIKNYTGTAAQNKKLASIVNEADANPIMDPGTGVLANAQTAPFNMFAGINPSNPVTPYAVPGQQPFIPKTIPSSFSPEGQLEKISPLEGSVTLSPIAETNVPIPRTLYNKDRSLDEVKVYPEAELPVETSIEKDVVDESNPIKKKKKGNTDWMNAGLTALNSLVPFVRPTNQRPLNPDQLVPEMMALSMNQLEPVQAQLYNPMLQAQPYRVSLQDQRNEVIAQQRAAERMSYGNPAAAAMIAAGSSDALNKINAEEFRLNQSETMRAAESNRAQMNEAQRVNLGILDKQYERQSMASSNTKQQALEVAKSLAQKQAENRKVNNRQAVLENMYPTMSFTKNGVAYKNPMYTAMFNIPDVGTGATSKEDITSPANFFKNEETTKKKPGRNGAIVKAIKGL